MKNKQAAQPVAQDPADQEILDRYFSGDADAMEVLVDRYGQRLFSFGLRMCGDPEEAEDMVQDTLLNVVRYLRGFRRETKLKNWLYRLASSACLKKRRGKNRAEREISMEAVRPQHDQGPDVDIPDWSNSPVESLLNGELRKRLTQAVGRLPHKYRLVFNLRDLEGFNTGEVADMLELSPQAVKTRLHRARAFLRKELAEYYQEQCELEGVGP